MAMKDQREYFGLTYFLTILGYYIKKSYFVSDRKTKEI